MTDLYGPDLLVDPPVVPGLQLVRRLGAGAHAEVWLATDQASGERVAVKLALDGGGARLAREAELLQRIDHPHVIRLRRAEPVQDGLARCTCNGELLEGEFKLPESGPIGVEGDRGQMEYRRIRIKSLAR